MSITRLKILVINAKSPIPVIDGAAIRSMQMIRMLSERYDVDLVYTCKDSLKVRDEGILYRYCKNVVSFTTTQSGMVLRGLLGYFSTKPLQCNYFYSKEAQSYIDSVLSEYAFVYCNNLRAAQYVLGRKCVKIIDYVDALSMNYKGASSKANWLWKVIDNIEYRRLVRFEQRILQEFDGHLIISPIDCEAILSDAGAIGAKKTIHVVNNSIELYDCVPQPDSEDIVFVGSMYYMPNIVASTYFAEEVLPLILQKEPNSKFYIVGAKPSARVRKLASTHVIVTGFVEDPKVYLCNASVVVVPMLTGAGVQNKILEAMSMGCCVVTTPIGVEGLDGVRDKDDIYICKDAREMAQCVVTLMHDKDLRERIGRNAHTYIERNLSYPIISSYFHQCMAEILSGINLTR
ncbi:MAG: glycosyltransferase [Paludibacteraceae bacterium]